MEDEGGAGTATGTGTGTGSEVTDRSSPIGEITVKVKFGGRWIPVKVSPDSTVKNLKSLLQPLTNALPRGQKLIFQGKILEDEMKLSSSKVTDGAKIMLLASHGLHQGSGPILKEASSRPISRRTTGTNSNANEKIEVVVDKSRLQRWKATGVIALSESNLKAIPDEVWTCGRSARVLDVSNNSIRDLPTKISALSSLQKLLLKANDVLDESISWEGLTSLKSLAILNVSYNHLTTLPSALGALTSLTQLHVGNNKLTALPTEIGLLTQLQTLKAYNNRLSTIPESIGGCTSLVKLDLSENLLSELPETMGNLLNLKALHLSNNGLKSLPSCLLKKCSQLATLVLYNTEVTTDILREFEGWEDFNRRRILKHQKQLDFSVMGSAEFDEGADKN